MIIIYNLSGLVIGIIGFLVGVQVGLLSGMISLGFLALAIVWITLSIVWHLSLDKEGNRRPHPSVFFIPLPLWAVPIVVWSCMGLPSDWAARRARAARPAPAVQIQDPRAELLQKDNSSLSRGEAGDLPELAAVLVKLLAMGSGDKPINHTMFIRNREDAALILVHLPDLRHHNDENRRLLLDVIVKFARVGEKSLESKRLYVGIRGSLYYGAVQTPEFQRTGQGDLSPVLYDFYSVSPEPEVIEPKVQSALPEAVHAVE